MRSRLERQHFRPFDFMSPQSPESFLASRSPSAAGSLDFATTQRRRYPPSSEGGSVEAHLIALYADRSAVLSPLLGGGLR